MGFFSKALSMFRRSAEGEYRPGPWWLPSSGGVLGAYEGQFYNFWQMGFGVEPPAKSAIVQSCISSYAQSVSMCSGDHWRATPLGGRDRVTNSAAARILRRPNDYETIANFMLNLTWQLYETGNAYVVGLRNDRFEVEEMHLMSSSLSRPMIAEDGSLFYRLGGNEILNRQLGGEIIVPERDCMHVRLNAPHGRTPWPLLGESPLASLVSELQMQGAIAGSQTNFYMNSARPSAVLSTDLILDRTQTEELRQRWNEQSQGLKAGNTPILTAGLRVSPWATSSLWRRRSRAAFSRRTRRAIPKP